MAWLKKFCGRLGNGLRYSATIIYNTFPFPEVEKNIREKFSAIAEKILMARKNFPDSTLADSYNPTLMPKILREAHKKMTARLWRLIILILIYRKMKLLAS